MNVQVGTFYQEGFVTSYALVFENGMVLRSPSQLWVGKIKADQMKKDFEEIVSSIKDGTLVFEEVMDGNSVVELI